MSGVLDDPKTELAVLQTFWWVDDSRKFITKLFSGVFTGNRVAFFVAMQKAYSDNLPFELLSMSKILSGKLTDLEIIELISVGELKCSSLETLDYSITHLKELYFFRISLNVSTKIVEFGVKRDIAAIAKISGTLDKVRRALFHKDMDDHFALAVDAVNSPDEYIPTAFTKTNEIIHGFSRKALTSVGGKSGHNKTTFSLYNAMTLVEFGIIKKLLYISLDEPGEMIARRVIAMKTGISLSDMRSKKVKLSHEDVKKFVSDVYKGKLIILDNVRSPEMIQQTMLDISPDQTIIDHIQECDFPDNDGLSDKGINLALRLFKAASVKTASNTIILSQVRDKIIDERFEDKVPRAHDFYYASTMRQKSREQCVVYWRYKDSQEEVDMPFFDFIVYKSTYSGTGRVEFFIDPDHIKFVERTSIKKTKTEREGDVWAKIGET